MCTREEVRQEVGEAERRMEAKLEKSHMAIAQTISNFMGDMKIDLNELKDKADESIIDRNSVHQTMEYLKGEHVGMHALLKDILEQTKKTNGRVSQLENWKAFVLGAIAILTTLILPVVFMVASEVIKHIKL